MGLRFRKSIKLGKHFSVNLSPKGIGYSYGVKGARHSVSADGRHRTTYSVPGTGLAYTTSKNTSSNKSDSHSSVSKTTASTRQTFEKAPSNNFAVLLTISALCFASLIATIIFSMSGMMSDAPAPFFFIVSIIFLVLAFNSKWKYEHYLNSSTERPKSSPDLASAPPVQPANREQPPAQTRQEWYYINTQTKKIHRAGCRYAPRATDPHCTITHDYKTYVAKGFTRCNICHK